MTSEIRPVEIADQSARIEAILGIPERPRGLVIFAHGSGSGRLSPRNNRVAQALRDAGFATLLLDLLTTQEERDRANVFDIELLARRLLLAADWVRSQPALANLPIGLFGASTGAGAALLAAASAPDRIASVVSRGGRPDLAGRALRDVVAPTLLIVGGNDGPVIGMNEQALELLGGEKHMIIVPGAGHLFEERGTLDAVIDHAVRFFGATLGHRTVA